MNSFVGDRSRVWQVGEETKKKIVIASRDPPRTNTDLCLSTAGLAGSVDRCGWQKVYANCWAKLCQAKLR